MHWTNGEHAKEMSRLKERCAKIADAEPEPVGECPAELHLVPLEDVVSAVVRATKKNIAAAIRALP